MSQPKFSKNKIQLIKYLILRKGKVKIKTMLNLKFMFTCWYRAIKKFNTNIEKLRKLHIRLKFTEFYFQTCGETSAVKEAIIRKLS